MGAPECCDLCLSDVDLRLICSDCLERRDGHVIEARQWVEANYPDDEDHAKARMVRAFVAAIAMRETWRKA
jgi:hypothetical protein